MADTAMSQFFFHEHSHLSASDFLFVRVTVPGTVETDHRDINHRLTSATTTTPPLPTEGMEPGEIVRVLASDFFSTVRGSNHEALRQGDSFFLTGNMH